MADTAGQGSRSHSFQGDEKTSSISKDCQQSQNQRRISFERELPNELRVRCINKVPMKNLVVEKDFLSSLPVKYFPQIHLS